MPDERENRDYFDFGAEPPPPETPDVERPEGEDDPALLVRRGDIEERDLVRPPFVVAPRALDRIARVAEPHEVDPFDDAPVADIEARDHALRQHPEGFSPARRARKLYASRT